MIRSDSMMYTIYAGAFSDTKRYIYKLIKLKAYKIRRMQLKIEVILSLYFTNKIKMIILMPIGKIT